MKSILDVLTVRTIRVQYSLLFDEVLWIIIVQNPWSVVRKLCLKNGNQVSQETIVHSDATGSRSIVRLVRSISRS